MNNHDLIIIFIKAPRRGEVKTRLAQDIGIEKAQKLYLAMVEDLMQNLEGQNNFDMQIMVWPEGVESEVSDWLQWEGNIASQASGDLGKKLENAFKNGFSKGYQRIIIIGSDLPLLSNAFITDCFRQLQTHPLVLGPAMDGGYYLIGLQSLYNELFCGIQWSTSNVLKETLQRAAQAGLQYYLLPEMRDIDQYDDIQVLWREMKRGEKKNLSKTKLALQSIFEGIKVR
jgi:rSAM/selenodomain-associated transferase 1